MGRGSGRGRGGAQSQCLGNVGIGRITSKTP